ncbi:glycosyltransferase family 4 protein [Agromyces sp. ISL-38]|uniref:glycosyltransferase family 4 protein n=1 Tax=Agromyces sp. ISL-38 TaxID=2819107 RepID=UPI001BE79A40|nr:glycosyltransferase family 4 protein [Agromyces sp. ISL-38]MBT2498993.1 glycosyltransferase family 4 protein [Agromyces sp. ISL-38]
MAAETALALRAAGHDVRIALPNAGALADLLAGEGFTVDILDVPVLRKEFLRPRRMLGLAMRSLAAFGPIRRAIRNFGAEMVWVNTLTQPMWLLSSRILGIKVVCHVREVENDRGRLIRAGLVLPLQAANVVVCNSVATQRFVERSSPFPVSRKTRVVYNGKNWDGYFRSEPRPLSTRAHVLLVGRLNPRKGQDVAIRALAMARESGIDLQLTMVGDIFPGYEWYFEELVALAKSLDIEKECSFVGFTDDVSGWLERADIIVVPSRFEPFGTVAAEGMAAMRPTIVSATEGLVEIVRDNQTGLTVPPDDPGRLSEALRSLVSRPDLAEDLARAGFHDVRSRFSQTAYSGNVVSMADALVGAPMADAFVGAP